MCNPDLVTNIQKVNSKLYMGAYAGEVHTNIICDVDGWGTAWYHPKGIVNILALYEAKNKWRVIYNSKGGNVFTIHKPDHDVLFEESSNGLYYHNASNRSLVLPEGSKDQVERAEQAHKLYAIVGQPSDANFIKIIQLNLMPNCPVTTQDVKNAKEVFRKDMGALKGKTTRRTPYPVVTDYINVPPSIYKKSLSRAMCRYFFANKIPFLTSISRHIHFVTAQHLRHRKSKNILTCIKNIVNTYSHHGFKINVAYMDKEFDPLKGWLKKGSEEYIELVYFCAVWIKACPPKGGVSPTLSPQAIITGMVLNIQQCCRIPFGAYTQTHEEGSNDVTNECTLGAMCLGLVGNAQGLYKFTSLRTGKLITRLYVDDLHATEEIPIIGNNEHNNCTAELTGVENNDGNDGNDAVKLTGVEDNNEDGDKDEQGIAIAEVSNGSTNGEDDRDV
eukprot:6050718-Ditylum_brightwellii.AAC.2